MPPSKTRLKAPAVAYVAQSRDDVAADIRLIGDLQRDQARAVALMNDAIAAVTAEHQPVIDQFKARIEQLQQGVQGWCEANRDQLTEGGKVKFHDFITGRVQWRARPPSCRITGQETVIANLIRLGFERFIRTKQEINKEAILNEPAAVNGLAGIAIATGVEDFVVEPFEAEV